MFVFKQLFLLPVVGTVVSAQQCFFPDGTADPDGVVCNAEAANSTGSACCRAGDSCAADGSCVMASPEFGRGPPKNWYRQSCTDSTFEASACSRNCTSTQADTSIWLLPCTAGNGIECCWSGLGYPSCDSRCNAQASMFNSGAFRTMDFGADATATQFITVVATPSVTIPTDSTNSEAGSAITAAPNASPPPETTNESKGGSSAQTVGLAVGLSLGIVIILSAIGFLMYRRRRRRAATIDGIKEIGELPTTPEPQELPHKDHYPPAEMADSPGGGLPPYSPLHVEDKVLGHMRPMPVHELPGTEVPHEIGGPGPDESAKKDAGITLR